jgi:putative PIN family toxin of toxin-antitoxin system
MMYKAVADTNVLLAAFLSPNPASPNKEVLAAWQKGDWMWQHSEDTLAEYVEKLQHFGLDEKLICLFVKDLLLLGEEVEVSFFHLPHYPEDPDDIAFLLCALNGNAAFLLSYDEHLLSLAPHYPHLGIVQPRQFLTAIRDV